MASLVVSLYVIKDNILWTFIHFHGLKLKNDQAAYVNKYPLICEDIGIFCRVCIVDRHM